MFKRKTLFVVGAGASAEFKLPLGGELASAISKKMDIRFEADRQIGTGDMDISNQIKQDLQHNGHESQKGAWLIRDGILLSRSIDDFLDLHRSNPLIVKYGKSAIVKSILEAERASSLYFDGEGGVDRFSPERFADTWLVKFLKMLAPGIAKENVAEIFNDISFIVFNYDRCIEYFLLHALQKLYGISESKAREILRGLDIEHPFGVIDPSIPFGAPRAAYSELAVSVKTYTEQIAEMIV
jgi:hypothetical protein